MPPLRVFRPCGKPWNADTAASTNGSETLAYCSISLQAAGDQQSITTQLSNLGCGVVYHLDGVDTRRWNVSQWILASLLQWHCIHFYLHRFLGDTSILTFCGEATCSTLEIWSWTPRFVVQTQVTNLLRFTATESKAWREEIWFESWTRRVITTVSWRWEAPGEARTSQW